MLAPVGAAKSSRIAAAKRPDPNSGRLHGSGESSTRLRLAKRLGTGYLCTRLGALMGLRWMLFVHQSGFWEVFAAFVVTFTSWKPRWVAEQSLMLVPYREDFLPVGQKWRFEAPNHRRQSVPETHCTSPDRLRSSHPRAGSWSEEPCIPRNALCRTRNVRPSNNDLKHEFISTFTIWPTLPSWLEKPRRGPLRAS